MKRLALVLIVVFTQINTSYAQLTNGQVYDFQPGDVFQVTYGSGYPGPSPIVTDTIIGKSFTAGMDSITYVISRLSYTGANSQGNPPIYNYSIDTILITNLNAPATHFTYTSCLPTSDSTFTDSCGSLYAQRFSNFDTTCFEPPIWNSILYQGLGGPYYYRFDASISGSSNDWYSKTLTYYNSSVYGECGTLKTFTSIKENGIKTVKTYPNPAKNEITVETENPNNTTLHLYDIIGKEVLQQTLYTNKTTISIQKLPKGVYTIAIVENHAIRTSKLIKN